MMTRNEMLTVFDGGNIPNSSEWKALINKLYDSADGIDTIDSHLQRSEQLSQQVTTDAQTVSTTATTVAQTKADIELLQQTIAQLASNAQTAEANIKTSEQTATQQAALATQQAALVEQAGATQKNAIATEGSKQKDRVTTEGNSQTDRVTEFGNQQVQRVADEGNRQFTHVSEQTGIATGAAQRAETAATASEEALTDVVSEGNSQINRLSSATTLHLQQLTDTGQQQLNQLNAPLQLAGQYATASQEHRTASEQARDEVVADAGSTTSALFTMTQATAKAMTVFLTQLNKDKL